MNIEEKNYQNLLTSILKTGSERYDRTGVGTIGIFGTQLRFSLEDGKIPMLTTKKMFVKGVIEELLFFLRGDTDTKKLEAKGVKIWKGNTTREFLDKRGLGYLPEGDMGKGYGFQWRKFGQHENEYGDQFCEKGVDQLAEVVDKLKNNPDDRRILMTAWNPAQLSEMALPPCHLLCHLSQVADQVCREPFDFPTLKITKELNSVEDIEALEFKDFVIEGYRSHPAIKAEMAV